MALFEIIVNVFRHDADVGKMDEILRSVKELRMTLSQDFLELAQRIDAATTAVASRIATLQSSIRNSMTDEEVQAVKAGLQVEIDRLTVLGQDPANPVPAPPAPPA